jgi:hypothetical protein
VGCRTGLDVSGRSRLYRDSIPGRSLYTDYAIPTHMKALERRKIAYTCQELNPDFFVVLTFVRSHD